MRRTGKLSGGKPARVNWKDAAEQYRLLFENSPLPMWVTDLETMAFLVVNRAALAHYGYTQAEFLHMTLKDIRPPEDVARFVEYYHGNANDESHRQAVWRHRKKDGTIIYVESFSQPVMWQGRPARLGQILDVTEKRRLEELAQRQQERLDLALHTSNTGLWDWDLRTNHMEFSPEWKSQLGYAPDELSPHYSEWESRLHPDDRAEVLACLRKCLEVPGTEFKVEFRLRHKDGSYRWILSHGAVLRGAGGAPERMVGCHRDITKRKVMEQELRFTKEHLEGILMAVPNCVKVLSCDGHLLQINAYGLQKLQCAVPAQVLGRSILSCVAPEHREAFAAFLHNVCQGKKDSLECKIIGLQGAERWMESHAVPFTMSSGERAILAISHDVTEQRSMQAQLLQIQKMEAVGRLAGGIAHDFNNMLGIILGYSELALQSEPLSQSLRERLEKIHVAGTRAAALTRQLLAFGRKQMLEPRTMDLNASVAELGKMLPRLIGENIEMQFVLADDLGPVRADPVQVDQVILNLAVNARDAMPQGGRLTIQTANVELDAAYASQHPMVPPGPYVMLSVSDTGVGMDRETQQRVFEPFFTTKKPGQGTGMGLAVVYGIVKQSGGFIWVYSEPGHGTTFKIYFPRLGEPDVVETVRQSAPLTTGSETVLLVEDEPELRAVTRALLEELGYRVLEAGHGAEAIGVAQRHTEPIQLLITDVVMPEMNGRELAERLLEMRPGLKVLFVSGYTDAVILHNGLLRAGASFIQKPLTREGLAAKVREVLLRG